MKIKFLLLFSFATLISFAQSPPPTITSFTPMSGPVGTSVQIVGTNFTGSLPNTIVFFGATKATVTAVNQNTVTATVPVGATYNYITVTDISYPSTAYSPKKFNVTFPCGGLISAPSFAAKADNAAGSGPNTIVVGDLNGDGKSDIVVSNQSSNTISVFKNTSVIGTISFATALTYTTGAYPTSVALGDFNLDGKLDIATANFTPSSVSVFRNTSTIGAISFALKSDFTVGSHPFGIAINDLDADGYPEIVTANRDGNSASVLQNIGSMSFGAKVDHATGLGPQSVVLGDVDGDGKPDIVTANDNDNTISILRHTGSIYSLTFAINVDFAVGLNPRCIAIGDLDLDGKPDFVTANTNAVPGSISVVKNTSSVGTISCAAAMNYTTAATYAVTQGVSIGDIDGDGFPDIAAANGNTSVNKISVFKNSGTGTFDSRVDFVTGSAPYSVAIADLDGDGKADLSSANNSGTSISTLRNLINVIPAMANVNVKTICSGGIVNIPFTSNVPSTYVWIATNNINTTGESTTNQTNDTITDVIINNSGSAQTVSYTVTPTGLLGCAGTAQIITVIINPLPVVSFSGLELKYCLNASVDLLIGSPAGGSFSGAGITGNNFSPSIAGNGTHSITYAYTDGNTCTNTSSQNTQVAPTTPTPSICLVTVDSLSKYNIVAWEKLTIPMYDSMIVYRETATNLYQRIGAVSYDSISIFIDTVRTKYFPNSGDPNSGTYRYKIEARDSCGVLSAKSPYHNTIFSTNSNGSFSWPQLYTIEGSSNPVNSYVLLRDDLSNGTWNAINSIAGTQQSVSDPAYISFQSTASWRVETQWNISCLLSIKNPTTEAVKLNFSKSNINKIISPTSLSSEFDDSFFQIYPNPTKGELIIYDIKGLVESGSNLEVYNVFGESIFQTMLNQKKQRINFYVSSGVYFLKVKMKDGSTLIRKIIKE